MNHIEIWKDKPFWHKLGNALLVGSKKISQSLFTMLSGYIKEWQKDNAEFKKIEREEKIKYHRTEFRYKLRHKKQTGGLGSNLPNIMGDNNKELPKIL